MWIGIGTVSNPELQKQILEETLFDWTCPVCGYKAQMVYPLIYHDRAKGLMIYLAPGSSSEELSGILSQYPQMEQVMRRKVPTLAALKEKILIFDAGLDDVAVEMVKSALTELVEKKYQCKVTAGYFMAADESLDYIGFAFFVEGLEHPVRQGTALEAYHKSVEILKSLRYEDGPGFDVVDQELAANLLEEYQD